MRCVVHGYTRVSNSQFYQDREYRATVKLPQQECAAPGFRLTGLYHKNN